MQLPLTLTLRRSRRLDLLLAIMHAAAIAATLLAALPMWLRALLAATIAVSAWLSLRRLGGRRRVCALTLRADGRLDIERGAGAVAEAAVLGQSTVTAWLVVLLLRCEGVREAVTILPDALRPDEFRALRLWLRWRATVD